MKNSIGHIGYDALPAAIDATIIINTLAFATQFFFIHHVFIVLLAISIGIAMIFSVVTFKVLNGKRKLHLARLASPTTIDPALPEEIILEQEMAHEKQDWEKRIMAYGLQNEIHQLGAIRKSTIAVFMVSCALSILVILPFAFCLANAHYYSTAIASSILLLLSSFLAHATGRGFGHEALRVLVLQALSLGSLLLISKVF